jgi:DNA repair protein RecO (recombination protein O)
MTIVATPAVVLHSFKYSESSKIVRLATRDLGVQSAIAKGASKVKSKFGARLQLLSEGVAQLHMRSNRDLQTLAEFDVTKQRPGLTKDIARYAAAAALGELVLRVAPAEPNAQIYDCLVSELDHLASAADDRVDAVGIAAMWRAVSVLGFAPAIHDCARDGRHVPSGAATFSIVDGGFLCASCAADSHGPTLHSEDRAALERLVQGDTESLPPIPPRHAAAHRRLLARFVQRHASEDQQLNALTFWETLPWNVTS